MYQYINCPKCGKPVCMAGIGSDLVLICSRCKNIVEGKIDENGVVYTASKKDKEQFPKKIV